MTHELVTRHEPHTIRQVRSCDGSEHAMHRELTGIWLFYCNCGYSSGWVRKEDLPPQEELLKHYPESVSWVFSRDGSGA